MWSCFFFGCSAGPSLPERFSFEGVRQVYNSVLTTHAIYFFKCWCLFLLGDLVAGCCLLC